MDPVASLWVTLHRVGSDEQGPLDSTRTDSRGRYSFRYARTGDADAMYFVSASYRGIAYFTAPLQGADVRGQDAEITVFDTTSAHVPISVRGHHVIVSAVDANSMRSVIEVYDLVNDSSVTKVAAGDAPSAAVWSAPVTAGASGAAVREGDFPAEAVSFANGRVSLVAPFAPGLKQLSFTYSVPARSYPISFAIPEPVEVLEVMLEEKGGRATGGGLKEVDPVSVEGRNFRRFLASTVASNAVATVDLPRPPKSETSPYVTAVVLAFGGVMAAVLAHALKRK